VLFAGNDAFNGRKGDDAICGGDGSDTIGGGPGTGDFCGGNGGTNTFIGGSQAAGGCETVSQIPWPHTDAAGGPTAYGGPPCRVAYGASSAAFWSKNPSDINEKPTVSRDMTGKSSTLV